METKRYLNKEIDRHLPYSSDSWTGPIKAKQHLDCDIAVTDEILEDVWQISGLRDVSLDLELDEQITLLLEETRHNNVDTPNMLLERYEQIHIQGSVKTPEIER